MTIELISLSFHCEREGERERITSINTLKWREEFVLSKMKEAHLCLNADGKEPIEKGILLIFKSRGFIYCLKCLRRQKYLGHETQMGDLP